MVAVAVLGLAGSGAVAQGVSFSGSAGMGVKYSGDDKDDDVVMKKSSISWISDFDIAISASGTTDGGLTFGASTAVEAGHASSVVTDSEVYIGGESWQVKIGKLDPASHKGRSLGDVGFDGLGVDNVAEEAVGATAANVEVSFSLGAASLAITAGQTGGLERRKNPEHIASTQAEYYVVSPNRAFVGAIELMEGDYSEAGTGGDIVIRRIGVGVRDTYTIDEEGTRTRITTVKYTDDDGNEQDDPEDGTVVLTAATDGDTPGYGLETGQAIHWIPEVPASGEMYLDATKQDTEWAAGVSFAVGATTLGIGMDSNKLMQASISADLGAFGGKLFYAQQKVDGPKDDDGDDDDKTTNQLTNKKTGIGAEITVSAGANTTINAVYAQGKQSDVRSGTVMEDSDPMGMTTKGFGVGVSHGLGGGATLNAGFAKVEDVTKASVGVSMSF